MTLTSIRVRYAASVLGNFLKIGLGLVGGVIVIRVLGPEEYGYLSYLLGVAGAVVALLDFGMSQAFFTFLSAGKRGAKLLGFFFAALFVQLLIGTVLFACLCPDWLKRILWLDAPNSEIFWAMLAAFAMNTFWRVVTQMGESLRETVVVHLASVLAVVGYVSIITGLLLFSRVSIRSVLVTTLIVYLGTGIVLARRYSRKVVTPGNTQTGQYSDICRDFLRYILPLALYNGLSFFSTFFNAWFLQYFGGPREQAFLRVADRFSNVAVVASTSMVNIMWKEIAEANARQDFEREEQLYRKASRFLFYLVAILCSFLAVFSREIVLLLLGESFRDAVLPIMLLLLMPFYSTLSTITQSVFFGSSLTGPFTKVWMVKWLLTVGGSYFATAPPDAVIPGLGLGAIGMATSQILVGILALQVMLIELCRLKKWKYQFWYQFYVPIIFLFLGSMIKLVVVPIIRWWVLDVHQVIVLVTCGPVYLLACGLVTFFGTGVFEMERQMFRSFLSNLPRLRGA